MGQEPISFIKSFHSLTGLYQALNQMILHIWLQVKKTASSKTLKAGVINFLFANEVIIHFYRRIETSIEVECQSSQTLRNQEEEHPVVVSGMHAYCVISRVEQFFLQLILALLT